MTNATDQQETAPRQMTCVRRLYVLEDGEGRTWLAVEEPGSGTPEPGQEESPVEGGAMSHRQGTDGGPGSGDDREGGAMSHLVPGDVADVEDGEDGGTDGDEVTVVAPAKPGLLPVRLQAYRVSPALLPTASDPA